MACRCLDTHITEVNLLVLEGLVIEVAVVEEVTMITRLCRSTDTVTRVLAEIAA
jgi:hypothetical protein